MRTLSAMKHAFHTLFLRAAKLASVSFLWASAGLLSPGVSHGQDIPAADALMDCLRASFPGHEGLLDSLMTTFETELIGEGLMNSSEAADYRGLLQQIASEQPILRGMDSYFFTRFRAMAPDTLAILGCVEAMERYAARNPEEKLGRTLALRESAMADNMAPPQQAIAFLDILETNDFEAPIYRFLTYHLVDGEAYETATRAPTLDDLRRRGLIDDTGANLFEVLMNEAGQLIVADQLITPEDLQARVQRHARDFREQAVYSVVIEDDVKYAAFIRLKDQIALAVTQVRDDYSRRFLGKTLTELTPEEQAAVFGIYPLRIIAPGNQSIPGPRRF